MEKDQTDSASHKDNSASPMKKAMKLDELDEQLGESDEDRHETRRVDEQLGESDELSQGYAHVCTRRVSLRKPDEWL